MSLQWHSPQQACVAAWVHDVCGIAPAPSECQSVLDTYSCQMEAARMLHATLEAELWQRGIMSTEQRGVAALIRNETGMFPSVGSIDFYLHNNGSIESAATLLLVEYANQELRDYTESVQTHHRQQLAHMYNQRRPSALGLGGVDVATEQSVEGGGLGTQMVRNERDLAAEEHWNKLLATDTVQQPCLPSIHCRQLQLPPHLHRTSTATPSCARRSTRFCRTAMCLRHSPLRTPIRRHSSLRASPLTAVQRARC